MRPRALQRALHPPGSHKFGATFTWLQACIAAGKPIPNDTYTQLLESSDSIQALNGQLPLIMEIADCGFVDAAFRRIVDKECGRLKNDTKKLATAALIAGITLTITSFYFCVCIQCALGLCSRIVTRALVLCGAMRECGCGCKRAGHLCVARPCGHILTATFRQHRCRNIRKQDAPRDASGQYIQGKPNGGKDPLAPP